MKKLLLALCIFISFASYVKADITGWWYDPAAPGTGISVEEYAGKIFLAVYTFDSQWDHSHWEYWVSSGAVMTEADPKKFSGNLSLWTDPGANFGADFRNYPASPEPQDVGSIEIEVQDESHLSCDMTIDEQKVHVNLEKFMPQVAPGEPDNRIIGWWYDPAHPGVGFFLEARGGTLFGAWYYYRCRAYTGLHESRKIFDNKSRYSSRPAWLTFSGNFSLGATTFSAPFINWYGGSSFGSSQYHGPGHNQSRYYSVKLTLQDTHHIFLEVFDEGQRALSYNLIRFSY